MIKRMKIKRSTSGMDLFPFLSILVSCLGVLAFLQLIFTTNLEPAIEMRTDVSKGSKLAIQIFCSSKGLAVFPTLTGLDALKTRLENQPDVMKIISDIEDRRRAWLEKMKHGVSGNAQMKTISDEELLSLLSDTVEINQACRASGLHREEFLLFGIFPGGSERYYRIRNLMASQDNLALQSLKVGLEPLKSSWKISRQ